MIGDQRIVSYKDMQSVPGYPIDTARLRRVTEMAVEKSGWGKRKMAKGSGLGIPAHRSFMSYVASVVEVEVNDKGEIRIPRLDNGVDAGTILNPELVQLQFEGAAGVRTSNAVS